METNQAIWRSIGAIVSAFILATIIAPGSATAQAAPVLEQVEDALVRIAEKIIPAVVTVSSKKTSSPESKGDHKEPADGARRELKDFLAPITGFFKGHSDQTKGSPKGQSALSLPSIGSGIIVSPEGYILTASNKVKDMTETTVTLSDGRSFKAKLIGADPETNIAVVKIEAENLPVAAFGDSERVRVGALVVAVGNPFGLNHSVSLGVVSATGRTNIGLLEYENFIQTDAVINPGSGGGPLVNIRGEVVGIITGQVSHTGGGGWQGVGFAIPWNTARLVMEQLIAGGEVRRGRLGVSIQDVTEKFAKSLGHNKGAVVTDVKPGSPAEKAGLKVDDIIVEFNEHQIRGGSQLKNLVAQTKPGTNATLKIYRGGETSEVTITVGERKKMLDPAEVQIGR